MTPETLIHKACEENGITPEMFFGVRRTEEITFVRRNVCQEFKNAGMKNGAIARLVGLNVTSVRWLLGQYSEKQKQERLNCARKHCKRSRDRRKNGDLDGK